MHTLKLFSSLDQHLIFSRKAEGTGLSNVWVAWDPNASTRERVEWVNISTPDAPVMRWITATPAEVGKDVWNPKTQSWATRAESLTW